MIDQYKILVKDTWHIVSKELSEALKTSPIQDFAVEQILTQEERHEQSLAALQAYFDNTPDEVIRKDIEAVEASGIGSAGPTLEEYFEGLQPNRAYHILEYASDVSIKKFGNEENPLPNLHHLLDEVKEVIKDPKDIMEYADCLILLAGAYKRAGIGQFRDLFNKIIEKTDINIGRKWSEPDENGAQHHVDE